MSETSAGRHQEELDLSWTLRLYPLSKRTLDVATASVLLTLLLPLMVTLYLAVRLTSSGGGIYRQTRVGVGGTTFEIFKFRTMRHRCPEDVHREYVSRMLNGEVEAQEGLYKLGRDDRITRVGAFLRRTSLDELPQLVNVLRGEMSLIGPRPALPWEVEMFPAWALCRHSVTPGLTGLWQVSGRNRLTMSDGLRLDVEYVEHASFLLDLRILLRTIPAVVRGGAR